MGIKGEIMAKISRCSLATYFLADGHEVNIISPGILFLKPKSQKKELDK